MPRKPPRSTPSLPDRPASPGARVRMHPHGLDLGERRGTAAVGGRDALLAAPAPASGGRASRRCATWACASSTRTCPGACTRRAPGEYDFGEQDSRLDVAGFLEMAHDVGLQCVLRPGPHINAELTFFGIPERVVWDPECQARTPGGHPVMLPMVPVAFPVPELRERRVPRGDRPLVPRRGPAAVAPALARRPHRARAGRQRGRALLPRRRLRSGLPPRRAPRVPPVPPRQVPAPARAARRVEGRPRSRSRPWSRPAASTRKERARPRAARGLDRVPRAAAVDGDGAHGGGARRRGLRRPAHDAQPAAGRGRDAAQPGAHDGDRPGRPRLLPPRQRPPSTGASCGARPSSRAAARGASGPAYGAEVGAGFPPFFAPLDERRLAVRAHVRRWRTGCAASTSTWRSSATAGSARPSIPTAARAPWPRATGGCMTAHREDEAPHAAAARAGAPRRPARAATARPRDARLRPASRPAFFNVIGAGWRESVLERDFGLGAPPVDRGRGVPARLRASAARARRAVRLCGRRDGGTLD